MLQHQQNMLQDYVRTGTYQYAITENRADFEGRTVMDVGAGETGTNGGVSLTAAWDCWLCVLVTACVRHL